MEKVVLRNALFLCVSYLSLLMVSPALAQQGPQLLPPVQEALSFEYQPFPFLSKVKRFCRKSPEHKYCERVAQYEAYQAIRDDYCKNEGSATTECQRWRCAEKKFKWSRFCRNVRKEQRKAKLKHLKSCHKDQNLAYCEGVALLKTRALRRKKK